jgi:hypothetical protein
VEYVRSGETGNQLENNEQQVVDDEGPLASPFVGSDSEDDGSDGTKHENEGDSLEIVSVKHRVDARNKDGSIPK